MKNVITRATPGRSLVLQVFMYLFLNYKAWGLNFEANENISDLYLCSAFARASAEVFQLFLHWVYLSIVSVSSQS